jgi:excisionase family DNA binding protein
VTEIDAGRVRIVSTQEGPMVTSETEWLTVAEVAQHFRVSARSVSRWAQSGDLQIKRIGPSGRLIRIHRSVLESELNSANTSAAA